MLKTPLVLLLLCAPALADTSTTQIGLSVTAGKDTRHYAIKLVDKDCGGITAKNGAQQDEINICTSPEGKKLRLSIDWITREGDRELRNRSTVVAARGEKLDLDNNGVTLGVSVD